jgi:hypothetical protein
VCIFEQLSALADTYHFEQTTSLASHGGTMQNLAELMQRLLEIQSGGRLKKPRADRGRQRFDGWSTDEAQSRLPRAEALQDLIFLMEC